AARGNRRRNPVALRCVWRPAAGAFKKGGSLMGKTFAPLVAGLSLLLALPAPAEEQGASVTCPPDDPQPQVVQLRGVLRREQVTLTVDPPITVDRWTLAAGGKTYHLVLRRRQELLERAEKLVGRPVVVAGILDPAGPYLWVTSLRADESVKETIRVEVRGRLVAQRAILGK